MATRRIEVEILGDASKLQAAFGQAGRYAAGFQGRMARVGDSLTRTGRTLNRNVTLPIVGAGIAAGKLALDFNRSMTSVQTLVGASQKQIDEWSSQILALSGKVGRPPKELADALYFVTSSGIPAARAMDVVTASAKAAFAGLGETKTVADAVTSAMNAYGAANLSASKATDVLLATVREGKAEPDALAAAIGRVIAPAQAMGVTFGQVGGAVAGLSLGGLDAAESVTGLRAILTELIKPAASARATLEDAGMSIAGLRKEVADKGLLPTLQKLRDRFGDNKDALGKLFPNVRALNAFLALTGQNAEKNAAVMRKVTGAVGDTDRAAAAAAGTLRGKLDISLAKLQASGVRLGGSLLPIVVGIAQAFARLGERFSNLSPRMRKVILIAAGLVAALGPVLSIAGHLILVVRSLSIALAFLAANPVVLLIAGIAALGVGLVVAYKRSETFRNIVNAAFHAVAVASRVAVDFIRSHWMLLLSILGGPFGAIAAQVIHHWSAIRSAGVAAFNAIVNPIRTVISWIQTLISWINAIPKTISIGIHLPHIPGIPHIPGLATGGIVTRPTMALIGERGPEAVIPLNRTPGSRPLGSGGDSRPILVRLELDGRVLAERLVNPLRAAEARHMRSNGGAGFFN